MCYTSQKRNKTAVSRGGIMNNYSHYAIKTDIKELVFEKNHVSNSHCFDASNGKINSCFAFVKKGTVTLNSADCQIEIPEGSLFYIPDGVRYNSVWSGKPNIEYYCLHMITNKYDLLSQENYAIQHIPQFSNPNTEAIFDEMYALLKTKDRINEIKAIGMYYILYSDIMPHLKTVTPATHNPALISAMEYIEKYYAENFDINELATFCCISESRLHHLFQSELKTTPIKYRNQLRIENATVDLLRSNDSIEKIAEKNGFHSTTYFRKIFGQYIGISPAKYRKQVIKNKQL